ncbi:MAG: hypothetical protein JST59_15020 [Actinobacteria bacterium]|nr:hypothetical protein [Actinomycetota bacterium]
MICAREAPGLVARDLAAVAHLRGRRAGLSPDEALGKAVAWLVRTHDVTGRKGSSKGYSLLHGWMPAYPETTGYVLEILLWRSQAVPGSEDLAARALEMGRWLAEVQEPDGGIMLGHVETPVHRSIVFNTGQVLHGWMTLEEAGVEECSAAADRAARFLVDKMNADGTWDPAVEYSEIPHTYNSRVTWAMLRYATLRQDEEVREAALRQLDWTVRQQTADGWFENCTFKGSGNPNSHALAYTTRGLLESYALVDREDYLAAALKTATALADYFERNGDIPAEFDAGWSGAANYRCLTGIAQLGGVWHRLATLTGDDRWARVGADAVRFGLTFQTRSSSRNTDGALAGSDPIWGRYAPMQYPNWATRFLAETLMIQAGQRTYAARSGA